MTFLEIVAAMLIGAAMLLALCRLLIGPGAPDRLVAADTLSMITTVAITGFAVWFDRDVYLDIALVYSTLAFAGIVALARAMEGDRS